MAQPVFDEHPLEEYLRQSGEAEPMPGGVTDFTADEDIALQHSHFLERVSKLLLTATELANSLLASSRLSTAENAFAERFKYDVISSSLLSSTLSPQSPNPIATRVFTFDVPGRLKPEGKDENNPIPDIPEKDPSGVASIHWPAAILSVALAALSSEYYFMAIMLLGLAAYVARATQSYASRTNDTELTMEALKELIQAANAWDMIVSEAMNIVEGEERRPNSFYGPTSPQSPFSTLRVALQSSLHTTQTQCDNVRQLLAALTSPSQLSQICEMYAPASPKGVFLPLETHPPHQRPLSDPTVWRRRTSSVPTEPTSLRDKRATWNGSYLSLAQAGFTSGGPASTSTLLTTTSKKDKRKSDISSLFVPTSPVKTGSISAPATPQTAKVLADVIEEDDEEEDDQLSILPDFQPSSFGMAALDLQRKRRSMGLEAFKLASPPPKYTREVEQTSPSRRQTNRLSLALSPPLRPTVSSSTRFTLPHTTRHPLSLSSLRHALQAALGSKRYACSHLLALRFDEESDDEAYWEDVRSVVSLLVSAFGDASGRLQEVLGESLQRKENDGILTPVGAVPPPFKDPSSDPCSDKKKARTMAEMHSFAPMPSQLSRFASHVDAISSALNDARDHLEECIGSLGDSPSQGGVSPKTATPDQIHDLPALQAYDRLRKELAYALRECERGRERLIDIVAPRPLPESDEDELEDDPATPPLVADCGSESSSSRVGSATIQPSSLGLSLDVASEVESAPQVVAVDDATEHLLITATSEHLPPPGIEQVFEADPDLNGSVFMREKSKLTRDERIKLAKARRESAKGFLGTSRLSGSEDLRPESGGRGWAPGGEVVQELKDVIWKVGEKRRKMSEQFRSSTPPNTSDLIPSVSIPPQQLPEEAQTSRRTDSTGVQFPRALQLIPTMEDLSRFQVPATLESDPEQVPIEPESELVYLSDDV
ncbi:hypothetical protein ABKN59_010098 [Abortiporus biennis]